MKTFRQKLLRHVMEAALLVVGYQLLSWWLLERNIVSLIFAAGQQAGWFKISLAAGFIVMRPLVIIYVPAILVARVGILLWEKYKEKL